MSYENAQRRSKLLATLFVLVILFLALSGCAGFNTYEISVGANTTEYLHGGESGGFAGPRDVIEFAARRTSTDGKRFCEITHLSHLSAGWPVNDRTEDYVETIKCGYSFGGNQ